MVWFTNEKKIQELANNLANLHVKYDNLKRENKNLEDRIVLLEERIIGFSNNIHLLQEDITQHLKYPATTSKVTSGSFDHSKVVTNANIVSTVITSPYSINDIISSSSFATSYDCAYSSDSSSCSDSSSSCSSD
jgi:hypothetical protein